MPSSRMFAKYKAISNADVALAIMCVYTLRFLYSMLIRGQFQCEAKSGGGFEWKRVGDCTSPAQGFQCVDGKCTV